VAGMASWERFRHRVVLSQREDQKVTPVTWVPGGSLGIIRSTAEAASPQEAISLYNAGNPKRVM
jgi:hypothetical protein